MTEAKKTKNTDILVSKAVRTVLAGKHRATAKAKTRAEVRGGGRKPWRQKGTGRARAGSTRSPIWRGGGVNFGPTGSENYSLGINKKEIKVAKEAALSAMKQNTVSVETNVITKTKEAVKLLSEKKITEKTLVIISAKAEDYKKVRKAFANIPGVKVALSGNENIHDILSVKSIANVKVTAKKGASK